MYYRKYKGAKPEARVLIEPNNAKHETIYHVLPLTKWGKVIESHWQDHLQTALVNTRKDFGNGINLVSFLVKGTNNVGKSMFVKAFCNAMLTQLNTTGNVFYDSQIFCYKWN